MDQGPRPVRIVLRDEGMAIIVFNFPDGSAAYVRETDVFFDSAAQSVL